MRAAAKRIIKALTLAAFAAAVLWGAVWASGADNGGQAGREETQLLVVYKNTEESGSVKEALREAAGLVRLDTVKKYAGGGTELLEIDEDDDIDLAVERLREDPRVEYAQRNYILYADALADESRFDEQWGLLNSGQLIQRQAGTSGVDINIVRAWEDITAEGQVPVGLLDTGVDTNHSELEGRIYANPGETPGNGMDDDGNGYIDDTAGWDFSNGDNTVFDSAEADTHGTFTAGVIAGRDDKKGITGVAPHAVLVPLKFMEGGSGYTSDAIEGIEYAQKLGIRIVNCGWSGEDENEVLKKCMQESGLLFVCPAGNGGDGGLRYPACFGIPNVLSVAAVDNNGRLAAFSNYGEDIRVAAPGVDILSILPGGDYGYKSGTSFACGYVTGLAAILMQAEPDAAAEDIIATISANVTHSWELTGKVEACGWINAYTSLNNILHREEPWSFGDMDTTTPEGISFEMLEAEEGMDEETLAAQLHFGEEGVSAASGNFCAGFTDMALPLAAAELRLDRTYNSLTNEVGDEINNNYANMLFGPGWSFSYQGRLRTLGTTREGDSDRHRRYVMVETGNGRGYPFTIRYENTIDHITNKEELTGGKDALFYSKNEFRTADGIVYHFNDKGFLDKVTDKQGNAVTIQFSTSNPAKMESITDYAGRKYSFHYHAYQDKPGERHSYLSSITDPSGRSVIYGYTDMGATTGYRLSSVTDPMGNIFASYGYDSKGRLTRIVDGKGKAVQQLGYSNSNVYKTFRVSSSTDAFGNTSRYSYDKRAKVNAKGVTTVTDSSGRREVYWYDDKSNITGIQDPEGKIISNTYNPDGDIMSYTDRYGNTTIYNRDAKGNITRKTNPDRGSRTFRYDDRSNLTQETDELGNNTYYSYNSGSSLIKKVQPLNKEYIYNNEDRTSDRFAISTYEYYPEGSYAAGPQNIFESGINTPKGLLWREYDPEGRMTEYAYYPDGRLKSVKKPGAAKATVFEYNAIGWKTAETTPKGLRTEYRYDNNGRLEKKVCKNPDDPAKDSITRIVYDVNGNKIKEISPNQYNPLLDNLGGHAYDAGDKEKGRYYNYAYWPSGKLMEVSDPEGWKTAYTYDIHGNMEYEEKPGGARYTYEYDNMDRPVRLYIDVGPDSDESQRTLLEEYSYAKPGESRQVKISTRYLNDTEKAVTEYIYDYAGRAAEQKKPDNSAERTVYNPNGTLDRTVSPSGTACFTYDGLNRLTGSWTPFESAGGVTKYTYKGYAYDRSGRKTAEKSSPAKVEMYEIPQAPDMRVISYSYYDEGWLECTSDGYGRKLLEYSYDDDGNLEDEYTYTGENESRRVEYVNGMFGKPAEKRVYTGAGDGFGVDRLTTFYTYDRNGNPETVTTPDLVTTRYKYDRLDRQTAESRPGTWVDDVGMTVGGELGTSTKYNWAGKVAETTDARGNKTYYDYNSRGLLEKVKRAVTADDMQAEYTTAYYYDRAGRKTAEVSPLNYRPGAALADMDRTEYAYDVMDRLSTKTEVFRETVFYPEEARKWVRRVTKAYKYDERGNKVKELDALGYEGGEGGTAEEKINTGVGTEYAYNLANLPISELDPVAKERGLAYSAKYEYDGLGRKTAEIRAADYGLDTTYPETGYEYDDARDTAIMTRTDKDKGKRTVQVNKNDRIGNLLEQTDANGDKTLYEYNVLNKVRKAVYPGDASIPANTVTYAYDVMGSLTQKRDAAGYEELYTYDAQGRTLTTTEQRTDGSESTTTSAMYDQNGNKRFETDGNSNTVEKRYDELDRLVSEGAVASGKTKTTSYTYDANGNRLTQTDWRGNTYTNVYDPINRLIEREDPYTSVQKLEYNHSSLQERSYDAVGKLTQYEYDRNGRETARTDPEGHVTRQAWDNAGNVMSKTDGRGNTTRYQYDGDRRLVKVINAKGEATAYTYDPAGNVLTRTDGKGNTITYEYNAMDKPVRQIDPGGRQGAKGSYTYDPAKTESYTYYADGDLKTRTDRNGRETAYEYYAGGRIKSETAGGETTAYKYDGNGNTLEAADASGSIRRTYDEEDRVLTKSSEGTGTITYVYDITEDMKPGWRAEKSIDPKGNETVRKYDAAGRLKTVISGGQTADYYHNADGGVEHVEYKGGPKEVYTYYGDGLLKTLKNYDADGTLLDSYAYTYDAAHNILAKEETVNKVSKGRTDYAYDALNRLEGVTGPSGRRTGYAYDAAGNRAVETVKYGASEVTTRYGYDSRNRLGDLSADKGDGTSEEVSYSYDDNGNLVFEGHRTRTPEGAGGAEGFVISAAGESGGDARNTFYEYDARNRLVKAVAGADVSVYEYDAEGLRTGKTYNGQDTKYLYEYGRVVLELDGAGNQTARNIYGTNLLWRTADGQTYGYLYNGHGDVTALTDASGNISASYYYDAFGNISEQSGTADNNINYAGYQYDRETGLYYLNARMYDPVTARFMQEDTYTGDRNDPLSLNLYTYCHNEPLMYTDPTGHREDRDAFIFDKNTKQIIDRANSDYQKATIDYNKGLISKTEMKKRQETAEQKAEDARANYARNHTIYRNITVSEDKGQTVYTMNGGEKYIVVDGKPKLKPENGANAYKGDIGEKAEDTISIQDKESKFLNGKYDRFCAVEYITNPNYSSPGKGDGSYIDYFTTKKSNPIYFRFDNPIDRALIFINFDAPGILDNGFDCANFTSQALAYGGTIMTDEWHYFGYNLAKKDPCTISWSTAKGQYEYFSNRDNGYMDGDALSIESYEEMQLYVASSQMQTADLLYWANDNGVYHSTMISGFNKSNEILYSAHTTDRINNPVKEENFTEGTKLLVVRILDYAVE